MKRLLGVLTVALLFASCTSGRQVATPRPSESNTPKGAASPSPTTPTDEVLIYAAVIEELVLRDHTFGSGRSPFRQVYVIDGSLPKAGDPMGNSLERPEKPFPEALKEGILAQLADTPPTEFVSDPDEVRRGPDGMYGVRNRGVIVS